MLMLILSISPASCVSQGAPRAECQHSDGARRASSTRAIPRNHQTCLGILGATKYRSRLQSMVQVCSASYGSPITATSSSSTQETLRRSVCWRESNCPKTQSKMESFDNSEPLYKRHTKTGAIACFVTPDISSDDMSSTSTTPILSQNRYGVRLFEHDIQLRTSMDWERYTYLHPPKASLPWDPSRPPSASIRKAQAPEAKADS